MKNVKVYTVIRVDSTARKWKPDHEGVAYVGTYFSKRDAEQEFKRDLAKYESAYSLAQKKFWRSVKERRIWEKGFATGHRWTILEQAATVYPWDEDPGRLKINPKP